VTIDRLTTIAEAGSTEQALARIVSAVGLHLSANRCWLYARHPERRRGVAAVRWLRTSEIADLPEDLHQWSYEPSDLPARDPLFAHALAGQAIDVIDDATCGPVDAGLEQALGHRAFVHLNLHARGSLWGTLQPGMTRIPRHWTTGERSFLLDLRPVLAPMLASLVAARGDRLRSQRVIGRPPDVDGG
jgi:GAF domain-containing protein